jgi:hypothetical protein
MHTTESVPPHTPEAEQTTVQSVLCLLPFMKSIYTFLLSLNLRNNTIIPNLGRRGEGGTVLQTSNIFFRVDIQKKIFPTPLGYIHHRQRRQVRRRNNAPSYGIPDVLAYFGMHHSLPHKPEQNRSESGSKPLTEVGRKVTHATAPRFFTTWHELHMSFSAVVSRNAIVEETGGGLIGVRRVTSAVGGGHSPNSNCG